MIDSVSFTYFGGVYVVHVWRQMLVGMSSLPDHVGPWGLNPRDQALQQAASPVTAIPQAPYSETGILKASSKIIKVPPSSSQVLEL